MPDFQDSTRALAEHCTALRWEDLPEAVVHEAKRALLNCIGCALGGGRQIAIDRAVAVLRAFNPSPQATLIGRHERVDVPGAAFINAMSANIFDFDDTHLRTVIHPSAPVLPALLAWSEHTPVSGKELLLAFTLGVEVACRIGNAISPEHYERGWHITSTCGVFGAAVALGKLLGLDAQRMAWAIGNASVQAAGLVEALGVDAKSISVGNAARNGMLAALLAQQDFAGPEAPLEGRHGFLRVLGDAPRLQEITGGWGEHWELMSNAYKPYPCGVVLHPVIDACLEIASRKDFSVDAVHRVTVRAHPLLRQRTDRPNPETGRLAQVSLQHCIGVVLRERCAGLTQFTDVKARDTRLRDLGARVVLHDDTALPTHAAHVAVDMQDSARHEVAVQAALGSIQRPMRDADLEVKFRELVRFGSAQIDADLIMRRIWQIDSESDCASLTRMLGAAAAAGTARQ